MGLRAVPVPTGADHAKGASNDIEDIASIPRNALVFQ
jgi:hypothetical protein